mmetsp:Transcript_10262/g.14010  ORF Transcript_10262/g.14010 Transcript_10262/m.14010 type:complete len:380 (+) Transcript_10262:293-1432(+)|eukprot:CAMPEP_0196576552 /NCGR_PEP_ID=MMETSP1081-20130531/5773_1 /TAXON_ID=36882 /ORGANISM="Pyramimonas amylifera, Strain CCMP720" /LENGTH=379 /DNA_ID=CAMNT_0041895179 /DNA_START=298 /DNA_END=1437 /DNA_ORIENTATION=-
MSNKNLALYVGGGLATGYFLYTLYKTWKNASIPVPDPSIDKAVFLAAYDRLVAELLYDADDHPQECVRWTRDMIAYNIPGGKNTRGLSVVQGVRCIAPHLLKDPEMHFRVCVLGWCVEWLQGMFLVADDIMDHSEQRRGKQCWYKRKEVEMIAVNDALMLDALIYRILKMYFRDTRYYTCLVDMFHEVTFHTTMGELNDLLTAPIGNVDLDKYSLPKYKHIVKFKTSLYSFYLPVAAAMLVCGLPHPGPAYKTAYEICCHIGEYFQIQDDFIDCFGDPKVIGKIGTDIEDNKCSWLVCQALLVANPKQTVVLKANYGKDDKQSVRKVKDLYKELNLEKIYQQYEEDSYKKMNSLIDTRSDKQSKGIFTWLLKRIYKRTM